MAGIVTCNHWRTTVGLHGPRSVCACCGFDQLLSVK